MATTKLCRGEHCPNRQQCRRYLMHMQRHDAPSVSNCPDGKWFDRDPKNIHPQFQN